jgi:protein tyrosine phosphatase
MHPATPVVTRTDIPIIDLNIIPKTELEKFTVPVTQIREDLPLANTYMEAVDKVRKSPEFRAIATTNIGQNPRYTSKNRTDGIKPNDHNLLSSDGALFGTMPVEYLNANLMEVPAYSTKRYIGAQGPLKDTVADFFNVLLDKDSRIIVANVMHMETKIMPDQTLFTREKCYDYWNHEVDLGNGFRLQPGKVEQEFSFPGTTQGIIVRSLVITKDGAPFRKILQFHYQFWPDHGGPHPVVFAQFEEMVNRQMLADKREEHEGPVTSHCSAGRGRTGTYLGIRLIRDYIEQQLAKGTPIDKIEINIPKLILDMNLCRNVLDGGVQCNTLLRWTAEFVSKLA